MIKKTILAFLCSVTSIALYSQWEPDLKLSSTPGSYTSDNNAWSIAASDNKIHVIWTGSLTLTDGILYKHSLDGGITWNDQILLSAMYTYSSFPAVAVAGNTVHAVWSQTVGTSNTDIFYNRSTDGGVTWTGAVSLTNSLLDSQRPCIAVNGQNVYVVWEDSRDYPPNGNYTELYFKHSSDGGATWSSEVKLTTPAEEQPGFPSLAVTGELLHLAYSKTPFNVGQEIYYTRSANSGSSWSNPVRLSFNNQAGVGRYPTIGAHQENVYVFWSDSRDQVDFYEVYFARSLDAGSTWGSETRLTYAADDSYGPNVAVSGEALHLTWNEFRDGNWEIYYKKSADAGLSWSADARLSNDAADSWLPSVAVTNQIVNVVWCDKRDGEWNLYYKRNPTGNPVGIFDNELTDPGSLPDIEIWPNPSTGIFNLKSAALNGVSARVEVVDLYGKVIGSVNGKTFPQPHSGFLELDLSSQPSGVYFLRIRTGNDLMVKKIVKL